MVDLVNHPPHYTDFPTGLHAECIEYTRHMPFSQGNAFKYIYRAGAKGDAAEDIAKSIWYIEDALMHGIYINAALIKPLPKIDCEASDRALLLHCISHGLLNMSLNYLKSYGSRIIEGDI